MQNILIKALIGTAVAIGGWITFSLYVDSLPEPPKRRGRKRNPEKLSKSTFTSKEWNIFEEGREYERRF